MGLQYGDLRIPQRLGKEKGAHHVHVRQVPGGQADLAAEVPQDVGDTAVSGSALSSLAVNLVAHAAGSDVIRIGMVGCGGRCTGAAGDAMSVDPGVRLVVMGQLSCYTGREVTGDQAAKSDFFYPPKPEGCRFDMEPPAKPGPNGRYPVCVPGQTTLL